MKNLSQRIALFAVLVVIFLTASKASSIDSLAQLSSGNWASIALWNLSSHVSLMFISAISLECMLILSQSDMDLFQRLKSSVDIVYWHFGGGMALLSPPPADDELPPVLKALPSIAAKALR